MIAGKMQGGDQETYKNCTVPYLDQRQNMAANSTEQLPQGDETHLRKLDQRYMKEQKQIEENYLA